MLLAPRRSARPCGEEKVKVRKLIPADKATDPWFALPEGRRSAPVSSWSCDQGPAAGYAGRVQPDKQAADTALRGAAACALPQPVSLPSLFYATSGKGRYSQAATPAPRAGSQPAPPFQTLAYAFPTILCQGRFLLL